MGTNVQFIRVSMALVLCISIYNLDMATADVTATAYGYSHIQTFSGHEYSFNGKGEYVFLDVNNGNLTIQVRTDYVVPANKDITMVTAVALKSTGSCKVEMLLNRVTHAVDVFTDRIYRTNSKEPHGPPTRCGNSIIILRKEAVACMFRNGVRVKVSVQMSTLRVEASARRSLAGTTTRGLAGAERGEYLISKNNLLNVTASSTEEEIYPFTESWSLTSHVDSLFNYSISDGDFTTINSHTKPAHFPEDLAKNTMVTALYAAYSDLNVTQVTWICSSNGTVTRGNESTDSTEDIV